MARIIQLIFALSCLTFFAHGMEIPVDMIQRAMKLHSECMKEINVDPDMIQRVRNGKFTDDRKFQCYLKCLFEKIGMVTDDGDFDYDVLLNFLPEAFKEMGSKIIEDCRGATGANLCEKAYNFHQCAYKTNPKAFILNQ